MNQPDWSHYRALLAVLREGSLSGAARRLGLAQPTLGRQIADLESALGVALFIRSPRGLLPTDAARDLAPHAEAMGAAAQAMARAASGGHAEARGTVRITASEIVGVEVLPPILADFRRAHPAVAVELALSNALDDLSRGDADIALRMVAPTQQALVARKIGAVELGLYAHRRYVEAHPQPIDAAHPSRGHTAVGFDSQPPYLRALAARLGVSRDDFAFRSDSDLAQLAAIRAGFGVGFIQRGVARREPDLVPLGGPTFSLDVWVVLHEDLRASRRMRLMFDHLVAGLTRYVAGSGQ